MFLVDIIAEHNDKSESRNPKYETISNIKIFKNDEKAFLYIRFPDTSPLCFLRKQFLGQQPKQSVGAWKMKNKPNFAEGEKAISSLKTRYYENFVLFEAEKNKANLV